MAQRPPRPGDDYDDFYGRPPGDRPASERSVRSTRVLLGLVGVLAAVAVALGVLALVSVGDDEGQDQADPGSGRLQELQTQVESLRERISELPDELAGDRGDQQQPTEDTGQEDQLRDRIDELEETVRELRGGSGGEDEDTPSAPAEPDAAP